MSQFVEPLHLLKVWRNFRMNLSVHDDPNDVILFTHAKITTTHLYRWTHSILLELMIATLVRKWNDKYHGRERCERLVERSLCWLFNVTELSLYFLSKSYLYYISYLVLILTRFKDIKENIWLTKNGAQDHINEVAEFRYAVCFNTFISLFLILSIWSSKLGSQAYILRTWK